MSDEQGARGGFESRRLIGAFARPAGDERCEELVPGGELARCSSPTARCQKVALLRQGALQLSVLGEPGRLQQERGAIEETPPRRRGAGHELALGLAPGDHRQQGEVLGDGRRLPLQLELPAPFGVGDRELPGSFTLDLGLNQEGRLAVRRALTETGGAKALSRRRQVERFEEAALAGTVRAVNEVEAARWTPVGWGEGAKARQSEAAEVVGVLGRSGLGAQMRIGMMTQR